MELILAYRMLVRRCTVFLSQTRFLPSKAANLSTSYQLVSVRNVRTHTNGGRRENPNGDNKDEQSSKTDESKSEGADSNQRNIPPFPQLTPDQLKRLKTFGILSFVVSGICTYILMRNVNLSNMDGEAIPFDEFLHKFLRAGEVKQITYFPARKHALVTLFEGAVIDGKPFGRDAVIVKYDHATSADPKEFEHEIRRFEEKLKIPPQGFVPITTLQLSTFRTLEFALGAGIILFLLMGYTRVIARRLMEQKAKNNPGRPFQKEK